MSKYLADLIREEHGETPKSLNDTFVEQPVPLTTFVQDKKFLANPPLSAEQYVAVRHFEQVLYPETYADMVEQFGEYWDPVRYVNFIYLQWGKGSGKDHICRVALARVCYLLCCMHNPLEYFDMPAQDTIHALNVASSSSQAHRAFFKPLKRIVETSPWFKDKANAKEYSIEFENQIEVVSGHSNAETMEGLNILAGIADEISAFKTNDELDRWSRGPREPTKSAEGILNMIRSSARTRFARNFKLAAISYPRFKGDAIQQLTNRGRTDNDKHGSDSRIYVSGPLATWDVNPRVKGRDDFREDYEENPAEARAKYECLPELSANAFFKNELAVNAAFADHRTVDPVGVHYWWGRDHADNELVDGWQVKFTFAPDLKPIQGAVYAMHGDIAITGDRAGVAMAHVQKWETSDWVGQDEDGMDHVIHERRPKIKLDFAFSFETDITALPMPREVQIRWYRKLAWELMARGFNIRRYTFDGFQSIDSMQILQTRGIEAKKVSTDTNPPEVYNTLRDVIYDGRLVAYWRQEIVDEILALTKITNGKVDHPPYGSKDEADAVAGAVYGALESGGAEDESGLESFIGGNDFAVSGGIETPYGLTDFMPSNRLLTAVPRAMPKQFKRSESRREVDDGADILRHD